MSFVSIRIVWRQCVFKRCYFIFNPIGENALKYACKNNVNQIIAIIVSMIIESLVEKDTS